MRSRRPSRWSRTQAANLAAAKAIELPPFAQNQGRRISPRRAEAMTFVVTSPGCVGPTFDDKYCVGRGIPPVRETWRQYGLHQSSPIISGVVAPLDSGIAKGEFINGAALGAALVSRGAVTVFGEIPAFTKLSLVAVRCEVC